MAATAGAHRPGRRWFWIGAAGVAAVAAFVHALLVALGRGEPASNSDVRLYYDIASKVLSGLVPYRDFRLEYPVLALPFFLLPRLFTADVATFQSYYQLEVAFACL